MLKIKKKEYDFSKKSYSLSYFSLKVCALADFQVDNEKCPPICPPNLVPTGQNLSFSVTLKNGFKNLQAVDNEHNCHGLSLSGMENKNGGPGRTRTCDPEIMSH